MNKRRKLIMAAGTIALTRPLKALSSLFSASSNVQNKDQAFYSLADLETQLEASNGRYLPFLNVEKLKTGLYTLAAGSEDKQQPHAEDEVYYVASGRSQFRAGDETTKVEPGAILYVKAEVEHRFFDIEEDLKIVVFFSNMK